MKKRKEVNIKFCQICDEQIKLGCCGFSFNGKVLCYQCYEIKRNEIESKIERQEKQFKVKMLAIEKDFTKIQFEKDLACQAMITESYKELQNVFNKKQKMINDLSDYSEANITKKDSSKEIILSKERSCLTPTYYSKGIEPIDYILSWDMDFCEGSIIKYITRWKYKHESDEEKLKDLEKALDYLQIKIKEVKKNKEKN